METPSQHLSVQGSVQGLSEIEMRILDFESAPWQRGTKTDGISELFGMPPARYYEKLNALLDKDASLEYAPLLVKRLRRLREARIAAR